MKAARFLKSLSSLLLLNGLVKPLWIFGIDRQVQVALGHETYGRYFAVLALSFVLLFLADAGLSNMLNQRVARGETFAARALLRWKALLTLAYLLALFIVALLTGLREWEVLAYVAAIQVLNSFFVFGRSLVTAHQHFSADAFFSVLDKGLMILFCTPLLYMPSLFGAMNLQRFLQVQCGCTFFALLLVAGFVVRRNLLRSDTASAPAKLLPSLLPFALIILAMSVHYRLDGFLIERLRTDGAEQAGIYATAYRLLDAGNMVGYLAASFLVPFIARHQGEPAMLRTALDTTRHGLLFFGLGVALFAAFQAPWMQQVLYHTGSDFNSDVIRFCLAALPGYLLVHIYGSVLTATARFRDLVTIVFLAAALNLLLNLFLVPRYGALGAAYAALASQTACGLACWARAGAATGEPFGLRQLLPYGGSALLLGGWLFLGKWAMLNVWLILAGAVLLMLLLLATQIETVKTYFLRTR